MPPLKIESGEWVFDNASKANAFARAFADRWSLRSRPITAREDVEFGRSIFVVGRSRLVKHYLRLLSDDSATGPDGILAIFLKQAADEIA